MAEQAAAHVRRRRPELFGPAGQQPGSVVTTKSTPTDPVTVADTETEELIRELLARARPGEEILGEEAGGSREVPDGVRWVVDPIDGTVNFLYGVPAYAVSVAAQIAGRSVAGAVVDVSRGVTYWASAGGGAFSDAGDGPVRLSANPVDRLELTLVATGFGYEAARRVEQGRIVGSLLPQVRDIRRIGAAALDLCLVAAGAVDAHYEHGLSPWDWAAGGLIAAEAGAVVRTPAPDSWAAEGQITYAVAPQVAERFVGALEALGALDPIGV